MRESRNNPRGLQVPAIVIDSAGSVTNSPQQTITGTYAPQPLGYGRKSFVRIIDGADGAIYVLGDTNPDTSNRWSITVTLGGMTSNSTPGSGFRPGSQGVHSIVAQATDLDGNRIEASAPVLYTLDTVPPVLTFAPLAAGVKTPAISVSGTINAAKAQFPVSIFDGAAPLGQAHAASSGAWSANVTLTAGEGAHTLYASARDAAGNVGESPRVIVLLNTSPPKLTIASATPTSSPGIFLLSGAIDVADISWPISILDGPTQIATVSKENIHDTGAWTELVTLGAGAHSITAKATNAAGAGISAGISVQGAAR